ncbi:hypothetical protein [Nonomuraea sp. NPDC048916]|uniref:hypothetical protein n=1 Tax=Nonomuraea sp. NPDC048916 TaxID=3154232 RepID=UPI0034054992
MAVLSREQLLASANDFSRRALIAYVDGDEQMILTNAAFALEHLSKAYLFDNHPALLVEVRNGHFDSLLHLTGLGVHARKLGAPRTIGAKEALARVDQLITIQTPRPALDQLIDVRDGVVHVGYLDAAGTRHLLAVFLRFAHELYDALEVDPEERWGQHSELVDSLISQSLSDATHAVNRKIAAAKRRLGTLMAKIPESLQATIGDARQFTVNFVALAPENMGKRLRNIHARCPACQHPEAGLLGRVEPEFALAHEPGPMEHIEELLEEALVFYPERLICGSCELQLEGLDELGVVGIPPRVELEPAPDSSCNDSSGSFFIDFT